MQLTHAALADDYVAEKFAESGDDGINILPV
jgi:hypothetical protein